MKGPNHIWHVDGNEKLKPYGLCLSGCMDGFSRRLIWLEVARTNKNPDLVCSYFLRSVSELNMVPRVVRLDRGTENVHLARSQGALRAQHQDELVAVAAMFGASTHNQQIECFWSYLRQTLLQDYMTLLRGYLDPGLWIPVIQCIWNVQLSVFYLCFALRLRTSWKPGTIIECVK